MLCLRKACHKKRCVLTDSSEECSAQHLAAERAIEFIQGVLRRRAQRNRHGHNEQDSPHAGFPLTYARVAAHPRVLSLYSERLVREGALLPAQLSAWHEDVESELQREYAAAQAGKYAESVEAWLATSWQGDALHVRLRHEQLPHRMS